MGKPLKKNNGLEHSCFPLPFSIKEKDTEKKLYKQLKTKKERIRKNIQKRKKPRFDPWLLNRLS